MTTDEPSPAGDIWDEATAELYLTDEDFEEAFERERTPAEKEAHELFEVAALLAEPDSELIAERRESGE